MKRADPLQGLPPCPALARLCLAQSVIATSAWPRQIASFAEGQSHTRNRETPEAAGEKEDCSSSSVPESRSAVPGPGRALLPPPATGA